MLFQFEEDDDDSFTNTHRAEIVYVPMDLQNLETISNQSAKCSNPSVRLQHFRQSKSYNL